jgi:hypothetical protein
MAYLSDLFNPSFLIFLGILVLVAALLVVYIETKNREQNHKISSMFSLVSSLADEVNGIKIGLTQMPYRGGSDSFRQNIFLDTTNQTETQQTNNMHNKNILISVSDDDDSSDDDDDENDEESSDVDDDEDEDDDDSDLESINTTNSINITEVENYSFNGMHNAVKILKINIQPVQQDHSFNEENAHFDFKCDNELNNLDELDDFEIDDELDNQTIISQNSINTIEAAEKIVSLKEEALENEGQNVLDISSSNFKTINIHLEDSNIENSEIDYKKFSLPKLRSIVLEKGLSNDTSKLKKNELLKLLEIE